MVAGKRVEELEEERGLVLEKGKIVIEKRNDREIGEQDREREHKSKALARQSWHNLSVIFNGCYGCILNGLTYHVFPNYTRSFVSK